MKKKPPSWACTWLVNGTCCATWFSVKAVGLPSSSWGDTMRATNPKLTHHITRSKSHALNLHLTFRSNVFNLSIVSFLRGWCKKWATFLIHFEFMWWPGKERERDSKNLIPSHLISQRPLSWETPRWKKREKHSLYLFFLGKIYTQKLTLLGMLKIIYIFLKIEEA